jgi:hypothetical protein
VYVHGYRAELISYGESLILMLEPGRQMGPDYPTESRIYLINPAESKSEMTYQKVWESWPPENTAPVARVVGPEGGATFAAGTTIKFQALASDFENSIRSLSFSLNGNEIGQAEQRTVENHYVYELSYTVQEAGEYSVVATAVDWDEKHGSSEPVKFTVKPREATLSVKIIAPEDGAALKQGTELELIAQALADGTDTVKVEFYSNGQLVGEGVEWQTLVATDEETFSYHWRSAPLGTHHITAKATASNGMTATSDPITITIIPPDDDEPRTFWVTFANPNKPGERAVVDREYSLTAGPLEGGRLIPGMRVVPDNQMLYYYGAEGQLVYEINSESGLVKELEPNVPGHEYEGWAMGVAYNKTTDRVVLVTLGGEGSLYSYDAATSQWAVISSMDNLDLDSLAYDAERNSYFGANAFIHSGSPVTVYEISASGERVQSILIRDALPASGPDYYTSEVIDLLDGKLALFLEPQARPGATLSGGESRIYVIDPAAKTATLTYRKVWTPNTSPFIVISSPANNSRFELGGEIRILANSRDAEGRVVKVEFFVNGVSIGSGIDLPTDSLTAKLTEKKWKPLTAGTFILTAKATDNEGAVTSSAPVTVIVQEGVEPTFSVSFARPGGETMTVFTKEYTLKGGAVDGGRLIPAMRVVPDKQKSSYYGAQGQEVFRISGGVVTKLQPSGEGIPELSWPMGVAYNLHTDYMFLVSLGGEGFLYAYEPVTGSWSLVTSMENLDLDSLEYDADKDGYFGTSAFLHRGNALQVYELSNLGKLVQTIRIEEPMPPTGPEYYTTETIDLPDGKVAVFVEPELHFGASPIGGESRIYVIDPAAKTATLTYKKLWVEEPNRAPEISISRPQNGASFPLGTEISIVAGGRDSDGQIKKIEFFVNGSSIGEGMDVATVALPGARAAEKKWRPLDSGPYVLTAKATDNDGAVGTSAPVSISVSGVPVVRVEITSPKNGSVFEPGAVFQIVARATQGTRPVEGVQFFMDDRSLGAGLRSSTDPTVFTFRLAGAPNGSHILTAKAFATGASAISAPVKVTVGSLPENLSAVRHLPEGYSPGTALEVKIAVTVADSVSAYAVEDRPPTGWVVSRVSHGGEYDSVSGKVKFGVFADHELRVLTYVVTPPQTAKDVATFSGQISGDGISQAITGESSISTAPLHHPADISPEDNRISLTELTAYAAAWKEGDEWTVGPNPIPLSYVTRAGTLWKEGELYRFAPEAGAAPLCWVPARAILITAAEDSFFVGFAAESGATREVSLSNEGTLQVQITVRPPASTSTYALEEKVPAGWAVMTPDNNGVVASGVIRWGPFYDAAERTITYTAIPAGTDGTLQGAVSFNGSSQLVNGELKAGSAWPEIQLQRSGGTITLQLSEAAPADAIVEAADSLDSDVWTVVGRVATGSSAITVEAGSGEQRFFRLNLAQ